MNIFYHYDERGNTIALSNDSARFTDTITYDPFGYVLEHRGSTLQPFTFLGKFGVIAENDSFYYMRARYYDAGSMRFITADAYPVIITDPYTLNKYIYVYDNPFNFVDPSGRHGQQDNGNSCPADGASYYMMHYPSSNDEVSPDPWGGWIGPIVIGGVAVASGAVDAVVGAAGAVVSWGGGVLAGLEIGGSTIAQEIEESISYVIDDPYKFAHIFGNSGHFLGELVSGLGGEEETIRAIILAIEDLGLADGQYFDNNAKTVIINGISVTVRFIIDNGVIKIGTVFVP